MADKARGKKVKGGKYCAAGAANGVSCKNGSHTPKVSIHKFPNSENDPARRNAWVKFVRKHRPNFHPSGSSVLCSVHFEPTCFTRLSGILPRGFKDVRLLEKGSVPTRDTVVTAGVKESTPRERRQITRRVVLPKSCKRRSKNNSQQNLPEVASTSFANDDNHPPSCEVSTNVELENVAYVSVPVQAKVDEPQKRQCADCCLNKTKIRRLQKRISKIKIQNSKLKLEIEMLKRNLVEESDNENDESDDVVVHDEDSDMSTEHDDMESEESHEFEDDANNDPDWAGIEDSISDEGNEDKEESKSYVKVDKGTPSQNEPKFLVFYTKLLALFSLFCFKCKDGKPKVSMETSGTMVTVHQECDNCGPNAFHWRSQPLVLGKYPAGNILLSFAVLMAGASITKVLLVLRHMGVAVYTVRTFFQHQAKFLFPVILHHWERCRACLIEKIKAIPDVTWCGDGRFDSMGHSAKYGVYTMFCSTAAKLVHFELLQANQAKNSGDMELQGAKRCFSFLRESGVKITTFVSDRHRSIAKWIRENQTNTSHFFYIWHVAKSICKKMVQASKECGCEKIKEWIKAVRRHIYLCATSTQRGFGQLILAKWKSLIRHINNKHNEHPDPLFTQCAHGRLTPRMWIKNGTRAYDKLKEILMGTRIQNDIKQLSSDSQTSCLEGFHSLLNQFHPKMLCFSWLGTFCRHILACLHFNENLTRETLKGKNGQDYVQVTYPKFKLGEEVVRDIRVPPTYSYVDDLKNLLFTLPLSVLNEVNQRYKDKKPAPLNTQFEDRVSKADAMKHYENRKHKENVLYPQAEEQDKMKATQTANSSIKGKEPSRKRKAPSCGKCGQPTKGHKKTGCSSSS